MEINKARIPKEYIVKIKDKTPDGYPKNPSIEDPTWTALRKHENILYSSIVSNHILHEIFERQKKLHSADKENSLLIVIDDYGILAKQTGMDVTKPRPEEEILSTGIKQSLDILFSRGQHFSTSIMCSFHDALQPSPLQLVNATNYILYRLNDRQYERIAPEIKCHLSDKEFLQMAHDYTIQPFNFLYVDLKAHKNEDVFTHGKPAALD
ncbi:hypothetical protein HDU90_008687 [Geranomyces variabilis]|nr:hypothetical protein HDU90_008687 [Geranomyces variabilis]